MFKAKLIANPSFVLFRKHAHAIHIIIFAIQIIIINMFLNERIDRYLLIFAIPAYVFFFYILYKLGRKIMNFIQDRHMELNSDSIRIVNKGGTIDFEIPASSIESINLQKAYKYEVSFENEIRRHLKGVSNFHFIQVYCAGQWYTLRFMLDSHYMENKLNEVIQHWKSIGIPIIYSEEPQNGKSVKSEQEVAV